MDYIKQEISVLEEFYKTRILAAWEEWKKNNPDLVRYRELTGSDFKFPELGESGRKRASIDNKKDLLDRINKDEIKNDIKKEYFPWVKTVNDTFDAQLRPLQSREILELNEGIIKSDRGIKSVSATLNDLTKKGDIVKVKLAGKDGLFHVKRDWLQGDVLKPEYAPNGEIISSIEQRNEPKAKKAA